MSEYSFKRVNDRIKLNKYMKENIKTYSKLLELEEKAFSEGALDRKTKELMALSISIVTKCEPCIQWHLKKCLELGAEDNEIFETIDISIEMGGGQAGGYARFVVNALLYHRTKKIL
ncbi:MAG: carboxymuconolactone decarboxylase family protein [Candidatus Sedimenticola sp. (ex Thyasira tokunagai)]